MKIVAWLCLGVVSLIIFCFVYYLLVGAILFKIVFSRRSVTAKVLKKDFSKKLKEHNVNLCWWEKQKIKNVKIQSYDGLILKGVEVSANSNKTVIIVHGFGGSYKEMQQYCQFFHEKNFNVLCVDNRAHGESEGKCIGYGWLDRKDIISWVNFINEKNPENKIVLFGVSMGGSAVCMTAGEKNLKNVVAIISDCAFDNANRQLDFIMKRHKIIMHMFKKHLYDYVKRLYDFNIMQADAIKQVKNTKVPILYIHGQNDNFVPLENLNNLYNATPENLRDKFIVQDAEHAMAYPVAGVLYEKKVNDFLKSRTPLNS